MFMVYLSANNIESGSMSIKIITRLKAVSIAVIPLFLLSCSLIFETDKPLYLLWDKAEKKSDKLIIFIPGVYDSVDKFKKEHFFSDAREAGIKADMVAININAGHLVERVMISRIRKDVFRLIRNDGYKNIWIVGVSIGGLSSLVYLQHHEKDLCGVVVIAPFLADDKFIKEVRKFGGIKKWLPEVEKIKDSVDEQINSLWSWLTTKNDFSNIYLGYGKQDRLIVGSHLLETFLEPSHVVSMDGEHDWDTGRKLWLEQLKSRAETGLLGSCN